jgi:Fe-S oxidoreductase
MENCTGDSARRAGNEYLYSELAAGNVETINGVFGTKSRRIVVTCPHCFHNLGKEYHQFGGEYEVVHQSRRASCRNRRIRASSRMSLSMIRAIWGGITT